MTEYRLVITGEAQVTRAEKKRKNFGDRRKMHQELLTRKLAEKESQNDSGTTRS